LVSGVIPPRAVVSGKPKGVMLTHRNMLTATASITTYLENVEDDVILACLPFSFDYGLYQIIMGAKAGARVVIEKSFTYPAKVLETMARERVTGFPGVPTMFAMLTNMSNVRDYEAMVSALPTAYRSPRTSTSRSATTSSSGRSASSWTSTTTR
jgi:acyl-CoA synthetase (AMP-forming)/AMP-acid ligase II